MSRARPTRTPPKRYGRIDVTHKGDTEPMYAKLYNVDDTNWAELPSGLTRRSWPCAYCGSHAADDVYKCPNCGANREQP